MVEYSPSGLSLASIQALINLTVVSKTDVNYTAGFNESVHYDLTGGVGKTLTLPPATGSGNSVEALLDAQATFARLTVKGDGAETIRSREDNNNTLVLYIAGDFIRLQDVGAAQWQVTVYGLQLHSVKVERAAAQTLVASVTTKIEVDSSPIDNAGLADVITNFRVTCARAASYFIHASYSLTSIAVGIPVQLQVYVNGAMLLFFDTKTPTTTTWYMEVSGFLDLAAGDYVEIWARQYGTPNRDTQTNAYNKPTLIMLEQP